jgi:hypothetical protein
MLVFVGLELLEVPSLFHYFTSLGDEVLHFNFEPALQVMHHAERITTTLWPS